MSETPTPTPELPQHPPGWVPAGWAFTTYVFQNTTYLQASTRVGELRLTICGVHGSGRVRVHAVHESDDSAASVWVGGENAPRLTQASITRVVARVARFHRQTVVVGFEATPPGLPSHRVGVADV